MIRLAVGIISLSLFLPEMAFAAKGGRWADGSDSHPGKGNKHKSVETDTQAPVINVPSQIIAEALNGTGTAVNFNVNAKDNVDGPVAATCTPASGSLFPIAATKVSCESLDSAGNQSIASFTVLVSDNTAPDISLPANIVTESSDGNALAVNYSVSANDAVDGSVIPSCAPASGALFAPGQTSVQCNASDSAGNIASSVFAVTVNTPVLDNIAPQITVPENIFAEATSAAGAAVTYAVSAIDDTDGLLNVACTPVSGSVFSLGSSTVHCSANDSAGNTATASFDVEIIDSQPPELNIPSNIFADSTDGNAMTINYTVLASDVVDGSVAYSCAPSSGTLFDIGETSVTCEAADSAGNNSLNTFMVTLNDASPEPQPAPFFAVNVGWQIPTVRTDGTALTLADLAEYAIVYDSDPSLSNIKTLKVPSLDVDGQPVSEFAIPDLPAGTYYFAIAAVDTDGIASNFSDMVTVSLH